MDLHDSVAVVTGSNRGLGREFAAQLLARGAKKVYATARTPESVQTPGVTPLGLDITDPDSVARAAAIAGDATLIVNNAGISTGTSLMDGDLARIELELETNFYGPLRVTRAFAALYAPVEGRWSHDSTDRTLRIAPPPLATRIGAKPRVTRSGP